MRSPHPDDPFVTTVKEHLDQSCEQLDPAILTRLRRARSEALRSSRHPKPWVWPLAGFATACAALIIVVFWMGEPGQPVPSSILPVSDGAAQLVEDVEVLTASEQLEFYEDLEFYGWLAEHEQAG